MTTPSLTVSIVSHGHHHHVEALLRDLNQVQGIAFDVVLTINVPEESVADHGLHFPLSTVHNPHPRGFGANHNAAFALAQGDLFLVLNPDIRLAPDALAPLLPVFNDPAIGMCAPVVVDAHGRIEDSVRRFPTLWSLVKRVMTGQHDTVAIQPGRLNPVDWVAGMFMLFRRQAYAEVHGFDAQRFFLYYEDVDICQRLQRKGWNVVVQPAASVVHLAQRSSHRKLRFAIWHATSAARYLLRI